MIIGKVVYGMRPNKVCRAAGICISFLDESAMQGMHAAAARSTALGCPTMSAVDVLCAQDIMDRHFLGNILWQSTT